MDNLDKLMKIDWKKLVITDHSWIQSQLVERAPSVERKITSRLFTIPFSGVIQEANSFIESLADSIEHYVFDKTAIDIMRQKGQIPFRKAAQFFGDTNPIKDGKYGELLLYILSEAILNTPMVSHKITTLTNLNDQVKGGDGVFFGKYRDNISILIGESKIYKNFSGALDSAFDSLDRFSKNYSSGALSHELFIARKNISNNFDFETMELIYQAFTPGSEIYSECIKTHPVLLMFEDSDIKEIENNALTKSEAENLFEKWLYNKKEEIKIAIKNKLTKYPDVKPCFLDFFLIPMSDVGNFKKSLYRSIHGIDYKP
ncbi:DUF1837 domain-containing protein [Salmonella enterica]|uniref:DUF1837 domain-containing protein n=2 Tax=Salmonella enterica TaxID=28901 RepID=A0A5U1CJB7_SALER|nr:DUF1837 domain-containing protein [Salmonella enterica]EBH8439550.1 DUF1837 domain-containing protein [Salmonella enterica subsp. enterica serovar 4,5,12:b:-]EBS5725934.1 DUF1837 domain-containing protein [Salmonella enterica subsp. enterica serovar Java]ECE6062157.1 DUF1837 domain-containing protein [Salmonella enterica subsp. enterica]ECK8587722.1 DUF1837 domain-containing protein [Salmonella enterica subsp. enterica serovar Paratyphi B]ECU0650594.1 DUF1837 domain-containing protein [Salm